jgi:hypothetical protein
MMNGAFHILLLFSFLFGERLVGVLKRDIIFMILTLKHPHHIFKNILNNMSDQIYCQKRNQTSNLWECQSNFMTLPPVLLQEQPVVVLLL